MKSFDTMTQLEDRQVDWTTIRLLRQQQNQEYEESLRADQEKDRKREEERKEQEVLELAKLNAQKKETERIRIAKEFSEQKVPAEPESSLPNICHLQIKLSNRTLKRRFLMSNTLEDVYHWIFSQPESPEHFEIITSYPKKVLYPSTDILSLQEAGLAQREVLHISDLDY